MSEGYHSPGDEGDKFERLNEFLCDYVDGTMDAAARIAFEEYLRANPELSAHVRALCEARRLLCHCGGHCQAPQGFQEHLRRELAQEMAPPSPTWYATLSPRLSTAAAITSGLALMLMVGMLGGASLQAPEAIPTPGLADYSVYASPAPTLPGWQPKYQHAQLSVMGPMTIFPPMMGPPHPANTDTLLHLALQRSHGGP